MLTERPTEESIAEWQEIHRIHRPHMLPNRKTGTELIAWLCEHYPVTELHEPEFLDMVSENVTENAHSAEKLPEGVSPKPRAFRIENTGTGASLYETQEDLWAECPFILASFDEVTGEFFVEGSCSLWDELFAYRGLDAADLENYFLVAEYIRCCETYGK